MHKIKSTVFIAVFIATRTNKLLSGIILAWPSHFAKAMTDKPLRFQIIDNTIFFCQHINPLYNSVKNIMTGKEFRILFSSVSDFSKSRQGQLVKKTSLKINSSHTATARQITSISTTGKTIIVQL